MKDNSSLNKYPSEWVRYKIEDLIYKFQNGYAFSSSGYLKKGKGIYAIVTIASISIDGVFNLDYQKANKWKTEDSDKFKKYFLNNGDLIIAMTDVTPSMDLIGRGAIVKSNQPLLLNQRVGLLKVKKTIDPQFLAYFFNSNPWRKYSIISASLGAQANISTMAILSGEVCIPVLNEQKKIVEIISSVDEHVQKLEMQISKLKLLKISLSNSLLFYGLEVNSFKNNQNSYLDILEKDFNQKKEYKSIGSFAKSITRKNQNKLCKADVYSVTKYNGFVRSLDYFNKQIFSRDLSTYKIVKSGEFAYSTIHLDEGSIGLLRNKEALISPMYSVFKVDESVDINYLEHFLRSDIMVKQYGVIGQGSVNRRKSVSFSSLKNLKIRIPCIDEQKKISDILTNIDKLIFSKNKKVTQSKLLKQTLLENLLKGSLRVTL
tara:strand:+ start:1595 stop:2887 length:1293 start_codon:yes stop_codon:yes gene_type:complete